MWVGWSGKEQVKATVPMCTSLLRHLCADLRLSEAPEPQGKKKKKKVTFSVSLSLYIYVNCLTPTIAEEK